MANLREDNLVLTIPKYHKVSSLVLILVIKQAIGLHIEKAKKKKFIFLDKKCFFALLEEKQKY